MNRPTLAHFSPGGGRPIRHSIISQWDSSRYEALCSVNRLCTSECGSHTVQCMLGIWRGRRPYSTDSQIKCCIFIQLLLN